MIIVQKPFGGRGDRAAFADCCPDRPIGGKQYGFVVLQSHVEGAACRAPLRHLLGGRETRGMLLEPLAAEELGTENVVVVPRRDGRSMIKHRCRPALS